MSDLEDRHIFAVFLSSLYTQIRVIIICLIIVIAIAFYPHPPPPPHPISDMKYASGQHEQP